MEGDSDLPLLSTVDGEPAHIFLKYLGSLCLTSYLMVVIPLSMLLSLFIQIMTLIILWPLFLFKPKIRVYALGRIFRVVSMVLAITLNPFWNIIVVKKSENIPKHGKVIFMFNHLTQADPWIASWLINPIEAKWIFKRDLLRIPVVGLVLLLAHDIPLKLGGGKNGWNTEKDYIKIMMENVKSVGEEYDVPIAVFPEGTRSKSGRLQPFKNGFFRFAVENGWEVVPCVMHKTQRMWPLGQLRGECGTSYAAVGDSLKPREGETTEQFKHRVRSAMVHMLRGMPEFDPVREEPMPHDAQFCERGHGLFGR